MMRDASDEIPHPTKAGEARERLLIVIKSFISAIFPSHWVGSSVTEMMLLRGALQPYLRIGAERCLPQHCTVEVWQLSAISAPAILLCSNATVSPVSWQQLGILHCLTYLSLTLIFLDATLPPALPFPSLTSLTFLFFVWSCFLSPFLYHTSQIVFIIPKRVATTDNMMN